MRRILYAAVIISTCCFLCFHTLHLIRVNKGAAYYYKVIFGGDLPITYIEDIPGGYRCYINEEEFVNIYRDEADIVYYNPDGMYISYYNTRAPILYKGG